MLKIILALTLIIWPVFPENQVVSGYLSQYDQSPTDGTLHYRQYESMEIDPDIEYDGFIASRDCDKIGQEAWLKIKYDDYESDWLLVVTFDCSGHLYTTEWMARDGIIAEVDYYTALEHGFLNSGNVQGELIWRD